MTSNLGTGEISKEPVGFLRDTADNEESKRLKASVDEAMKRAFRPEFLNRIDEIIVFDSLSKEQIHEIVDLMVAEIEDRLAEHGVTIELTQAAKDWLANEGYDRQYGARPLRRAIQRHIENPLSKLILAQEFSEGSHVIADAGDDGLTFNKAQAPLEAVLV